MRAKGEHEKVQKYFLSVLIAACLTLLFSCAAVAGEIVLSVNTDKAGYLPGENVTITGAMQSGGKGLQGDLALQINDPGGTPAAVEMVRTDAQGSFSFKYQLGTDNVKSGNYTVYLAIGDYKASTSFTVSSTGTNSGSNDNGGGGSSSGSSTSTATTSSGNVFTAADFQKAISAANAGSVVMHDIEMKNGVASLSIEPGVFTALSQQQKSLAFRAGEVTLQIPPGALNKEDLDKLAGAAAAGVKLTIAEEERSGAGSFLVSGLSCAKLLSLSMDMVAGGQTTGNVEQFAAPVTVQIKLSASELAGLDPDLLGVYYLNPASGKAEYLGGKIDTSTGIVTFSTSHFSGFAVMECKKSYTDVQSTHWAYRDILIMGAKHVMEGTSLNSFAPEDSVTRAQFAAMIVRSMGLKTSGPEPGFGDVTPDKWYYKEVTAAYQNGLVGGYDAATFGPDDPVTREQIAAMLIRALNKLGKAPVLGQDEAGTILNNYNDKESISGWAKESTAAAVKIGLVKGRGADNIAPKATATRAEGAALLKRFMQNAGLI
ncbi:S-layer homology domain-containing protein [Pelotomaculum isophthalicicum JI]|uniref:S-layer homology domain-containing protein n=1 Tax=Pelotomaculum isophthalicicum JI TaxID=947010 RepID=A0A9X4GXI4_9FIRM|nr:S-layer homology domain-containing protein [Pelotomaculum isophthalicicum]MDF9406772.1 S-layer homology domain-containing protein [Pelotomaculum isophthalicicum JI]